MLRNSEPRRTGKCGRGSEMSFDGDGSEYNPALQQFQLLQAAHVARHFAVSDALARAVAELAFAKGPQR